MIREVMVRYFADVISGEKKCQYNSIFLQSLQTLFFGFVPTFIKRQTWVDFERRIMAETRRQGRVTIRRLFVTKL